MSLASKLLAYYQKIHLKKVGFYFYARDRESFNKREILGKGKFCPSSKVYSDAYKGGIGLCGGHTLKSFSKFQKLLECRLLLSCWLIINKTS